MSLITSSENPECRRPAPGKPRVLLIGGAGYIGGVVAARLLQSGIAVRSLDLLVYGHQAGMMSNLLHPEFQFFYGDMGDPVVLDRALQDVDHVVLLAGLVGDPITKKFPNESQLVNDAAVRCCIDRLHGKNIDRVIFVSTCSNYGLCDEDVLADENSPLMPLSRYAASKVAIERHILSLDGKVDYKPTILRFATAFGVAPRMRFDLTVNEFTRELFLAHELVVYDAHTWRPYCHVQDFARLISHVLAAPAEDVSFQVFNAGNERNNHTKQDIVDLIVERLPNSRVAYKADSPDRRNYRVSFDKLRTKLGFECKHTVDHGIDELLWTLENHLFDDVDDRSNFFGNYEILRVSSRTKAEPFEADVA